MTSPKALDDLVRRAEEIRHGAYAPYSKFLVGAAILVEDGVVYVGANVENASYGLTICAERTAATQAVVHGARKFQAVAVAASGDVPPCGACRQFLAEFCAGSTPILLLDVMTGRRQSFIFDDLLPHRFTLAPSTH